jgi:glycosyltransferase involved in cell wall biosynthesis
VESKTMKKQFGISVVVTILNESQTIELLLQSLVSQTLLPHEIVIVDGGSKDDSLEKTHQFAQKFLQIQWQIFQKKGNRSVGRNAGITRATHPLIAITDAGCVPHSDWLFELSRAAELHLKILDGQLQPFALAGYYSSRAGSALEEAIVPYVLVMPDKLNPDDFLPATRSMLLTKTAWKAAGKFDEELEDNEDYAFAHALRNAGVAMAFTAQAKVDWLPRNSLKSFGWMIFRFARGDAFAGIWRKKVWLLFLRYLLVILWTILLLSLLLVRVAVLIDATCLGLYVGWAVAKNQKYAPRGWCWYSCDHRFDNWLGPTATQTR